MARRSIGIGPALDQAAFAQLVEQPGQRNRLQVEHLGQFGLLETLGPIERASTTHWARVIPNCAALWSA